MQLKTIQSVFSGSLPGLFATLAAVLSSDVSAAVKCQIREGTGCGGPVIYEMQLCAVITFNQGSCVRACSALQPICSVDGFDRWVETYSSRRGRNGIHGDLLAKSDGYDENGALSFTSEKDYTVCLREKTGLGSYSSPRPVVTKSCTKALVATADSCKNGTVFDPVTQQCIIQDPACGGAGETLNTLITQSQFLVSTQNNHFANQNELDRDLNQSQATAGFIAGSEATESGMALEFNSAVPSTRGSWSGKSGGGAPSAGAGAGAGGMAGSGMAADRKLDAQVGNESQFASANFGIEKDGVVAGSSAGANGLGGAGGLGNSTGGASWFGAGGSATAGVADGDQSFAGGEASRGLASGGILKIEDPADYFMRSDIDLSLFKRITTQCRKKEKDLVLAK